MSDQEITTFKVENHKNIIVASKLFWDEGVMPHRIVLIETEAPSLGNGQRNS